MGCDQLRYCYVGSLQIKILNEEQDQTKIVSQITARPPTMPKNHMHYKFQREPWPGYEVTLRVNITREYAMMLFKEGSYASGHYK